jgi:hypothetical protein
MNITLTKKQIDAAIKTAIDAAAAANNPSPSIGQKVKDALINSSNKIQLLLDKVLSKGGIITQEESDFLDEQSRVAKKHMMALQVKDTNKRVAIYALGTLFTIAAIWVISKKIKKDNNG